MQKPDLIELLESFNRKERYFLIKQALGHFELADQFRKELGDAIDVAIPSDSFTAMDYHLDSIAAALVSYKRGKISDIFDNPRKQDNYSTQLVTGWPQDIDLLVAFQMDKIYHLIMVEAKGTTAWIGKQIDSKADRLEHIFGHDGNQYRDVRPHFCLMSPGKPRLRSTSNWPDWMTEPSPPNEPYWLKLNWPSARQRVELCDDSGKRTELGRKFHIVQARSPSTKST